MLILISLCASSDKKAPGCTRASAADIFNLQQVSDGIHGCVQVGADGPDFDRCWSEAGSYYSEVLLTQKLLPVMFMYEICDEFFILQQGNAPAHQARETINLLERDTSIYFR